MTMRLMLVVFAALTAIGCDGAIHLAARVVDADGIPIEGATVAIGRRGVRAEAVTGVDGCVDLGGVVAPGRYWFSATARAPGRKRLVTQVATLVDNRCHFVLVAEEQDGDSQALCETGADHEVWRSECPDPAWGSLERD